MDINPELSQVGYIKDELWKCKYCSWVGKYQELSIGTSNSGRGCTHWYECLDCKSSDVYWLQEK
jgi:hypothetical protein